MIQDPISISVILFAVVIVADSWSRRFKNSKIMRVLPTPIWCYLPPTILTTLGVLPLQSPVYDWISAHVLAASLILILMTTDIEGLKKIGPLALTAILGSTAAVLLGGIAVFFLFGNQIGPESWKAVGTLSASWVGGTANELAVKQATGLSDELFAPLFIADITTVYIWMTFLMMISGSQKKIDRFLGANRTQLETMISHHSSLEQKKGTGKTSLPVPFFLLVLGFGLGWIASWIGNQIPEIGMAVSRSTWVIIAVTTVGLGMSFTRFARTETKSATKVGYLLFYLVLASTGAKAHLLAILKAPFFMVVCVVWMFIHGCLILLFGKLFKIPAAMLASASQANLGGVVSAPIVASTYEPKLVSIAVLLAIFSYAIGNYTGVLLAQLLRLFA